MWRRNASIRRNKNRWEGSTYIRGARFYFQNNSTGVVIKQTVPSTPSTTFIFPARCLVQIIRDCRRRLVRPPYLCAPFRPCALFWPNADSLRTTAAVRICYPSLQENTPACRNLHHSHHLYLGSRLVRSSPIASLDHWIANYNRPSPGLYVSQPLSTTVYK